MKAVGGVASARRPQDRTDVARFYAVTGAAHVWNPVCVEAAVDRGSSLVELARALALLNMAISDGLVASLDTKYHYHFWRPVTAIRAGDTDGNERTHADPDFLPLVATPPFPSYPSAHASASYAARTVIESLFGGRASVTLWNPALPEVLLEYRNLNQITRDIDDARVFGGIHFRFDQRAGARQGRQVGSYIVNNWLRPIGPGGR